MISWDQGEPRSTAIPFGGEAPLKDMLLDFLRHAGPGVVYAQKETVGPLPDADGDFTGDIRGGALHGIKGILDEVAQNGDETSDWQILPISMQGAGRVQGEQDIQFRRAIGFSNQ